MNIVNAFRTAFKRMKEKNWDYIYVLVDIHGTIFKPSWNNEEKYEFYPYAEEVLKKFSDDERIKIILWSSTKREAADNYYSALFKKEIYVDYFNGNPEIEEEKGEADMADFSAKPYFNVGIDDKFGFDPYEDWKEIYDYYDKLG